MTRALLALALAAALLAPAACAPAERDFRPPPADPEWLHGAVDRVTRVIVHDIMSPPQASRVYAYASVAAHEALLADHPEARPLAGRLNGLAPAPRPEAGKRYYLPLSGVYAFLTVGKAMTFSPQRVDSARAETVARFLALGIPRPVVERSAAYGEAVAAHVLKWAAQDHFVETRGYEKYTVSDEPGRWVPTAPAYMSAVEPNWGRLRPFTLDSAGEFRPPPPPRFDTAAASPFGRQVRTVWETSRTMGERERAVAAFWDCNPYVMNLRGHVMVATKKQSPGGHWMGITATAARRSGADLMRAADAYAQVAVALADGFISAWEEKYRSNVVRPETVIQAGLDPAWEPLLQTPPFPEYPSGHSVISTAAAEVLTGLFGPLAFADSTETGYGLPVRSFRSFRAAAEEAAVSRLYGGIHYPMSIEVGIRQGEQVGRRVVARLQEGSAALAARGAER